MTKHWPIYLFLIVLGMKTQEFGIIASVLGIGTLVLFYWLLSVVLEFIDNKKWKKS
jgi:hypothetical protein